jgi:hypothetical protein
VKNHNNENKKNNNSFFDKIQHRALIQKLLVEFPKEKQPSIDKALEYIYHP